MRLTLDCGHEAGDILDNEALRVDGDSALVECEECGLPYRVTLHVSVSVGRVEAPREKNLKMGETQAILYSTVGDGPTA